MASSPDAQLIEADLRDFSRQIHSTFPLRNFTEFYDEEQLKEKILQLKNAVSKHFFSKVWNRDREQVFSLLKTFRERMQKEVIAEWTTKNENHKIEFMSYLQKMTEKLCEDFQMALEDQVLLNPYMKMDSLKDLVERQKVFAINYFDSLERTNSQIKEERKAKILKSLDAIGEEVIEKQKKILERKSADEGEKLVDEVKKIIVEKWHQLKSYIDSHPGRVSMQYLKAKVEAMKNFVSNGKGSTLRESDKGIYSKLVETLEVGIKLLTEEGAEAEGNAKSPEEFIQWMEVFDRKVKSYCSHIEEEVGSDQAQRIQEDERRRRGWITTQQILRENSFDFSEREEQETETAHENGCNDCCMPASRECEENEEIRIAEVNNSKSNADDFTGSAAAAKKRARLRRSRIQNSSETGKDQTAINDEMPDSPPSKNRRVRANVSRKKMKKSDSSNRRQSSCENDKTPSRRSSHLKKTATEPVLTQDFTGDRVNATNESSSSHHDEMQHRECEGTFTKALKNSSARQPQSNNGDVDDMSASDSDESSEPRRSDLTPSLDQITSLGGDPPTFKCDLCKKKFKRKCYLKYHGKFCWKTRRYHKCDQCGKEFHKMCHLVSHIRSHTGEKPYKCPTCDKRFTHKCHLHVHIRSNHTDTGKARFVCEKCKQRFKSRANLDLHLLNHEGKLPYGCSYCDQRSPNRLRMMAHILTHSDERPFHCVTCSWAFCLKHQLVRHIRTVHHLQKEDADKQADDASLEYLRNVTRNENYDGDISSTTVLSHAVKKANLKIPNESDRTSSAPAVPSTRSRARGPNHSVCLESITILESHPPKYKCDVCSNEIKRKLDLKFHGKNCNKNGHKCQYCDKRIFTMYALLIHQRTHTGEKPFKCPTCNKQFASRGNLEKHIRLEKRRLSCGKCERSFADRVALNKHIMLKHEGKLPLGCSYCDHRCTWITHLKEHLMIHCEERPYKCPTCDRSFSWKRTLVRHIQLKHHHPKEDAMKLADEAGAEYIRKVTKNPNYDGDMSAPTVLSHAIKKANLKITEHADKKS